MTEVQATVVPVPPGKQLFTVSEIPQLLAKAKWPRKEGRCVSYLTLLPHGAIRTRMPEPVEQEALIALWAAQELAPPEFPLSESDWLRYADALELTQAKPAWSVVPCWASDAINQGILRAAAEQEFRKHLADAIAEGLITVRDPVTHMPLSGADAQTANGQFLVSRTDLSRFAQSALLEVVDGPADVATAGALSRVDSHPAEAPVLPGQDGRRLDAVGREIVKAIARIQESDTRAIVNQHTVMDELVQLVGQGCIKKATTNRQAIVWVTDSGKEKDLYKEALRRRLENLRSGA